MNARLDTAAVTGVAPSHPGVSAWLARHCAGMPGLTRAAVVLQGTEGSRIVAHHPAGEVAPAWLASSAAAAVARRDRLQVRRASDSGIAHHVTATPLWSSGRIVGAAVVVTARAPDAAETAALDATARIFDTLSSAKARSATRATDAESVLRTLEQLGACQTLGEAASLLTTRLAAELSCDRVSVGWRRDQRTVLLGSSDGWEFEPSTLAADACSAMDEAMDGGQTVIHPTPAGSRGWLVAAHAHLSERREGRVLCSVLLVDQGQVVGAVLAERRHGEPFQPREVAALELTARSISPWLSQRAQLDLGWPARTRLAMVAAINTHGRGRHRLAALLGTAAVVAGLGWPVTSEVSAPVRLEGAQQRIVTSPADNFLQAVHVRPGDVVKKGQVLLEFAVEDLRVERERLRAELSGHDAAVGDAMAKQDMGTLALRMAEMEENRAQLAILDQRLARATVTAPFDGVVIQGDLVGALGAPAKKGEALMTIAPLGDFHAIVEVDDGDIAAITVGQAGEMVLAALPAATLPVRVKRITPLAAVAPGRSFFQVEVEIQPGVAARHALRPGMRGFARLSLPSRARGLTWLQHAVDQVRLAWWRWVA